jgi:hypothetical protein
MEAYNPVCYSADMVILASNQTFISLDDFLE